MTSDSPGTSGSNASIGEDSFPDLHPTITLPESVIPMLDVADASQRGATEMLHAPAESAGNMDHIPGYEISAAIGRGAMGVVYRARQIKLQRLVALKVLVGRSHASSEDVARFNSEAITIAQIQHPNVMQIFDVGEYNGFPYLAAEYVDGGTLENKMNAGKMSIHETVKLMYLISRGVGAAHSKGVVHRDLKPSNILLTADGVPKVADFGLAKQLGPENSTMTGSVMGTPAYMAPEQASGQGRRIGPQTDVYALGVILYQCLTGDVPLKGDSLLETLERIRDMEPIAVRELRIDVPEEVEAICNRCLRKIPNERFPSADALADELAKISADWETVRNNNTSKPIRKLKKKQDDDSDDSIKQSKFLIPTILAGVGVLVLVLLVLLNGKKPATRQTIFREIDQYGETKPTVDHNVLPAQP